MFKYCNCFGLILNPDLHPQPWSTGLCHCLQNPRDAILTALFPCVTYGQIKEVIDEGRTSCIAAGLLYLLLMPVLCCQWTLGCSNRKRLRRKFNLKAAPCSDVFLHILCPCCALCQEFKELKSRGQDPALGWKGVAAQQQLKRKAFEQWMGMGSPPTTQTMSK